jgi:uncharacterized protein DUF2330
MNARTWSVTVTCAAVATVVAVHPRDAAACGGCFHPPTPPTQTASDITDERMLLSVSTTQSTLYDQIQYAGSPSSFAWVLPIHGTVDVGLSADVLFDSIDVLTTTTIVAPAPNCPPPPNCIFNGAGMAAASSGDAAGAVAAPVIVTKQENVGPYATVQLHSTDSSALEGWLSQNGFSIPDAVQPVIAEYVTEGFDFLAMKLLPNQGVQSMRPVRVTTPGASLSLPLRMASVGTGAQVGITIWVVSDGRYEPQNYPFFYIDENELVWDFSTNSSNYTTLRAANEAALGGGGWEIESSLSLNEQLISGVILSGGQYFGGQGGSPSGVLSPAPSDATEDYLAAGSPDAGAEAGAYQSAEDVRAQDIATLFVGLAGPTVRVTRIRGDIAHAAMTKDLVMQASADQSEVSNIRDVTRSVNLTCPTYPSCSGGTSSGAPEVGSSGTPAAGSSGANEVPIKAPTAGSGGAPVGSVRNGAGAAPASSQGGGCMTSGDRGKNAAGYGSLVALLGLAMARAVRSRRRRSPGL